MKKFIHIDDTDFDVAWARIVKNILNKPYETTKAGAPIFDSILSVDLSKEAILQIQKKTLHPQFPFKYVSQYSEEFTYEYQEEYEKKPDGERFVYTYFDRFVNFHGVDQLKAMKNGLMDQKKSPGNRTLMITWSPKTDVISDTPPCLQWMQIKYIGDGNVEVFTTWRSRDLYTAWQANIIALFQMLNEYVVRPCNCKIVRYVEFVSSAHIYKSDYEQAKEVRIFKSGFHGVN